MATWIVAMTLVMALGFPSVQIGAVANDADVHVEGIVEIVKNPNAVVVRTEERLVTVDLADLGGVTVSVTPGTKILAIGTMEPSGDILHAKHLESPPTP